MSTATSTTTEDRQVEPDDLAQDLAEATRVFLAERSRLLRIAHRVTGDRGTAEDVVQEAWMRWQRVDRSQIRNPAAFLNTATTHLALNVIQSARHRRELPIESPPSVPAQGGDPLDRAERHATAERTLGLLMSRLTAAELAAFLLRKSFAFPYREIAGVLRTSVANARQLVRRAHVALSAGRTRPVDPVLHRRLATAFVEANDVGDVATLVDLLADAVARTRQCRSGNAVAGPATGCRPPARGCHSQP